MFLFGLCVLHLHLQPSSFTELCLSALYSLLVSALLNGRELVLGIDTVHVPFFELVTMLLLLVIFA